MKLKQFALLFAGALFAGGCMLGPNYKKPETQLPAASQEDFSIFTTTKWWEVFEDPVLNKMEDEALAYNKDLALVDTYQGSVADSKDVQQAIEQKYQIVIDDLEVGYENERFVYYGRYQEDESLLYVYYDLMSGEFIKAVRLG